MALELLLSLLPFFSDKACSVRRSDGKVANIFKNILNRMYGYMNTRIRDGINPKCEARNLKPIGTTDFTDYTNLDM